jgi:hypothetical protein
MGQNNLPVDELDFHTHPLRALGKLYANKMMASDSLQKEDFEETIDFVLAWDGKNSNGVSQKAFRRRTIFEENLAKEGLILQKFSIKSKDLHFLTIRTPLEVLKRYGEILKLRMPVKEVRAYIAPVILVIKFH